MNISKKVCDDIINRRRSSPHTTLNKIARVIWAFSYWILFRFSPRIFYGWRACLLRCFGATVSRTAHIYPGVKIWAPWNLIVGETVGIADGAVIYNQDIVTLQDYVVISQEAFICTASHDYRLPDMPLWTAPITIKRGAWVAARAFIHPSVTIGDWAVVGACAVVTHDVEPYHVVAGNPAKTIKINEPKN